jgi:hypothetical protein
VHFPIWRESAAESVPLPMFPQLSGEQQERGLRAVMNFPKYEVARRAANSRTVVAAY